MLIGYVTVAEADAYVASHFTAASAQKVLWDAATSSDKQVCLQVSVDAINMLPYRSKKTLFTQTDELPRYPDTTVPTAAKSAQIENAVAILQSVSEGDPTTYDRLRANGVVSYRIGNLEETLSKGSSSSATGVYSAKALRLLGPYLNGGYVVR